MSGLSVNVSDLLLPFLSLGVIGLMLVASEILWNKRIIRGEASRKFVHVLVGAFIATWPFYMPVLTIQLLSLTLLFVVIISKWLGVFKSVHSVPRKTIGEISFAIGVGMAAMLASTDWIFAAAILHMSIADGLAAIIGTSAGTKAYYVFKQRKTIVGTLTFYAVSLVLTAVLTLYLDAGFTQVALPLLILLPLATTALENLAPYGTDNLVVPLLVIAVLNSLQF